MFVVTKNNPYYAGVAYFDNIEDAKAQMEEWIYELDSADGENECKVTIAQVIETRELRSDY